MVEEMSVTDGDQVIRVTISVGVISFPELAAASDQKLVKHADESHYSVRDPGRDRVTVG